jgi:peptide/nickel transport system substrate-binding protein
MRYVGVFRDLFLLGLVALVSACRAGPDAPIEVGDPEAGGTAVVAVTSDFQAFNPVTNTALVTAEVINFLLFTPLVQFDEEFEPIPALAESWELDEGGVTFRLRNDVRWHDGQPVTADDVLFTFELAKNEETASLLESAYLTMVQSARVLDPQTVRFDFIAPHSQPLQAFWWAPLPRHLLGDVAPAQLAQAPFNRSPVGNGPFRFASWTPQQQLVLEANQEYPEALGGRPYLDRVVFRIVPEATTRLTEILTGSIDINHTILPDEAQQVEGQRAVRLVQFPGRNFLYIGWNNEREPFRDPRVRQALGMAIDRQGLINSLMFGHGEVASGMIPSWSPVDPEIDPLPHDPEGARRLLQEAGWAPGPNGILTRNGQPLRFTLLSSEDRLRQDLTVVVQQQLRQIGIDVQVRAVEFQTLLQQHRERQYDAVLAGWSLDSFRVDPSPLFSCAEARRIGSPNRAGYCNPDADRLMEAGMREMDDSRAQEIWGEFSRVLQRDQPITFLAWEEQMAAVHDRLQNVRMDARGKLLNAREWWLPRGQRQ